MCGTEEDCSHAGGSWWLLTILSVVLGMPSACLLPCPSITRPFCYRCCLSVAACLLLSLLGCRLCADLRMPAAASVLWHAHPLLQPLDQPADAAMGQQVLYPPRTATRCRPHCRPLLPPTAARQQVDAARTMLTAAACTLLTAQVYSSTC